MHLCVKQHKEKLSEYCDLSGGQQAAQTRVFSHSQVKSRVSLGHRLFEDTVCSARQTGREPPENLAGYFHTFRLGAERTRAVDAPVGFQVI